MGGMHGINRFDSTCMSVPRRDIAKMETILRQRELAAELEASEE